MWYFFYSYPILSCYIFLFAIVLMSKIKGHFLFLFFPWHGWGIQGFVTEGGGGEYIYFYSLSVSWHICIPHLLFSLWIEIIKIEGVHFCESSSRLTIFLSCSDSHESCHSCSSSTCLWSVWRVLEIPAEAKAMVRNSRTTEPKNNKTHHPKITLETCTNMQEQSPQIQHAGEMSSPSVNHIYIS